jgi:hypothetical protein
LLLNLPENEKVAVLLAIGMAPVRVRVRVRVYYIRVNLILALTLNPNTNSNCVLLAIGTAPVDDNDEKANPFPKYRMVLDDIVIVLDKPLQVVAAPIEAPKLIFPPIV